jgi:hypothetical protein
VIQENTVFFVVYCMHTHSVVACDEKECGGLEEINDARWEEEYRKGYCYY